MLIIIIEVFLCSFNCCFFVTGICIYGIYSRNFATTGHGNHTVEKCNEIIMSNCLINTFI